MQVDPNPGAGCPHAIRMIVEIPKNSSNKYEYDSELGVFSLSRVLYSPMHCPGEYGFVPGTIAKDGGPLDVLAIVNRPTFPSTFGARSHTSLQSIESWKGPACESSGADPRISVCASPSPEYRERPRSC